jgi:16S rRNA (cytosine1402-N4)-methyltransferase
MTPQHQSVLLDEVLGFLALRPDGIYVDGTIGGGGHAIEIAKRLDPQTGRLIGLDLDPRAVESASERLIEMKVHIDLFQANYKDLDQILGKLQIHQVDGILLDLGFSSLHIESPERGFSFQVDAPLDMRYSPGSPLTAREIINHYSTEDLINLLREYGEERFAVRIATEIVRRRKQKSIETTHELLAVIERAIPQPAQRKAYQSGSSHPATRTFQALRIAVNDELENVRAGLEVSYDYLKRDGRLVVITFHSLEDRIVKHFMKDKAKGCTCPPDLPVCVCHHQPEARYLGEATPSPGELKKNPRARSARVRTLQKL